MIRVNVFILFIIAIALHASLYAANLRFLNDAPISYFNKEGTKFFENKVYEALDSLADKEYLDWQNPDNKQKGRVIIEATLSSPKPLCRRARILNYSNNQDGNVVFIFCKDKNNKWKITK